MTARRYTWTAVGAVSVAALGFIAGAAVSALHERDVRAQPWRALRVEHRGKEGVTSRTHVIFESSKLPIQGIEVVRSPEGTPELARVELPGGNELTAKYGEDSRPTSLEGPDGTRAVFTYKGAKVRVDFESPDGKGLGTKVVSVPIELSSALRVAALTTSGPTTIGALWDEVTGALVGEAWGKEEEDEAIAVQREVTVLLDLRILGKGDPGVAQVEANCPPFTCLPVTPDAQMPGVTAVRVAVSGSSKKSALKDPPTSALEPFKRAAGEERGTAEKALPHVSTVVAVVGVTALACKSLKLTLPVCVSGLSKNAAASAILGISSYEVKTEGRDVDKRAVELYYEDQARVELDEKTTIQLCVSREGFSRVCKDFAGRPFGEEPMPQAKASLELRRGIGGALAGSFDLIQSDGGDCKFSPSPRTKGTLKLSFDNETGIVTGTLKSDERGSRSGLSCSMGSASMRWSQNYTMTMTQTFTVQQLTGGGKLPLRLTGTMKGTGSYSFNGCSSGGAAANCPAGKSETYAYPVELTGEIDLDTQNGNGRLSVQAPLSTRGSWQVPPLPP